MLHSTLTSKGQTTIPGEIRKALNLRAGDQLEYLLQNNQVLLRPHPGTRSLKGALSSNKGKGLTFDQIRAAAGKNARKTRREISQ